jgi:short-subunit dehydrogenase
MRFKDKIAIKTTLENCRVNVILINFTGEAEIHCYKFSKPFHELPIEAMYWEFYINLKKPIYFFHAVIEVIIRQKREVIFSFLSLVGLVSSSKAITYSAAINVIIELTGYLAI